MLILTRPKMSHCECVLQRPRGMRYLNWKENRNEKKIHDKPTGTNLSELQNYIPKWIINNIRFSYLHYLNCKSEVAPRLSMPFVAGHPSRPNPAIQLPTAFFLVLSCVLICLWIHEMGPTQTTHTILILSSIPVAYWQWRSKETFVSNRGRKRFELHLLIIICHTKYRFE